ncbi:MAG: hypothetical protein ACKO7B_18905, partial [Flavobacteriales bacterium]
MVESKEAYRFPSDECDSVSELRLQEVERNKKTTRKTEENDNVLNRRSAPYQLHDVLIEESAVLMDPV